MTKRELVWQDFFVEGGCGVWRAASKLMPNQAFWVIHVTQAGLFKVSREIASFETFKQAKQYCQAEENRRCLEKRIGETTESVYVCGHCGYQIDWEVKDPYDDDPTCQNVGDERN